MAAFPRQPVTLEHPRMIDGYWRQHGGVFSACPFSHKDEILSIYFIIMRTVKNMTIGIRLRQWRKENKITSNTLAAQCGFSEGALSNIENDKVLPSAKILLKLNEQYGLSIDWLLTGAHKDIAAEQRELILIYESLAPEQKEQLMQIARTFLPLSTQRTERLSNFHQTG